MAAKEDEYYPGAATSNLAGTLPSELFGRAATERDPTIDRKNRDADNQFLGSK